MNSKRTFSEPYGAQSWRVRGAVFQLSPQAVDAVKGEGVGFGVGPDAVADVVHDAPVGDRHADVVGALAADFPPDDVAGLRAPDLRADRRQPEVRDPHVAASVEHHVRRLEVAVQDEALV